MARLSFIVPEHCQGLRVDTVLRNIGGVSGSTLKKAKQIPMGITQNGEHIRTIDPVLAGAVLEVDTDEAIKAYPVCDLQVETLYEDDGLVVYNKPPDLPIHPSIGHPNDTLLNVFASGETTRGLTFRAINRLDKDTSGLVFVAKNVHTASFYAKRVEKCYLALAEGHFTESEGRIDLPIGREDEGGIRRMVCEEGQPSVTNYRVIAEREGCSLVICRLETGRTHQIRVHLSHLGHPLLGDTLYGGDEERMDRQGLHCCYGEFFNGSGKKIQLTAPLPEDFLRVLGKDFDILPYLKESLV